MSSPCVLASIFSDEVTCWSHWSSLDVMNHSSFAIFRIVSLSLTFSMFTMMCLCVDLLACILLGIFWTFGYVDSYFHQIWTSFSHYFFKYLSTLFSPVSVCDSLYVDVGVLSDAPHFSESLSIFYYFLFHLSDGIISTHLFSSLLIFSSWGQVI